MPNCAYKNSVVRPVTNLLRILYSFQQKKNNNYKTFLASPIVRRILGVCHGTKEFAEWIFLSIAEI